ncbi:MAG: hypothetical protein VCA36_04530 [Opitutales bacterium]
MDRLHYLFLLPVFFHTALLAQNSTSNEEPFGDNSFWDEVWENPGEYSFILIIFVVLGYILWRVQGLGRDD